MTSSEQPSDGVADASRARARRARPGRPAPTRAWAACIAGPGGHGRRRGLAPWRRRPPTPRSPRCRGRRAPRAAGPPSSPWSRATTPAAPGRAARRCSTAGVARVVLRRSRPEPAGRRGGGTPPGGRRGGGGRRAGRRGRALNRGLAARRHAPGGRSSPGSSPPPSTAAVAAADGTSRWITGAEAPAPTCTGCGRQCDAILVGTGTVLADDPQLTVRDEPDGGPLRRAAAARRHGRARPARRRPGPRRRAPRPAAARRRDPRGARGLLDRGVRHVWLEGGPTAGRRVPARRPGRRGGRLRRARAARRRRRRRSATSASRPSTDALRLARSPTSPGSAPTSGVDACHTATRHRGALMFTGIVEELGTVGRVEDRGRLRAAHRARAAGHQRRRHGESIAVNGVLPDGRGPRRRRRSPPTSWPRRCAAPASARWRPASAVNLERAVAAGGRLGGHIVQGHVDGVGTILDARARGAVGGRARSRSPPGSPATSSRRGRSRSTASASPSPPADDDAASRVCLIPTTLALTTLGRKAVGDLSTSRSMSSRSTSNACWRPTAEDLRMNTPQPALQGTADRRRPRHHLARDRRQRLRLRLRHRRRCAVASGPGRSASSATCCCSRCSSARPSTPQAQHRCSARPAARCSSSSPASTAGGAGTSTARHGDDATAARSRRAGPRSASGRHTWSAAAAGVLVFQWVFSVDRRGLARAALVLLVRRLDLRRVDGGDLRDGPRLERLLARLDRGRPRRRAAALALAVLPDGHPASSSTAPSSSTASSSGSRPPGWSAEPAPELDGGVGMTGLATDRGRARRPCARAARCWSPTTRTARTRATSSSPPRPLTDEWMAWTIRHTSGYICAPMPAAAGRPARAAADGRRQP